MSWKWRQEHALALGTLEHTGPLIDLDEVRVRRRLERQHAKLLAHFNMDHLYVSEVRSTKRAVTQRIGRSLYEEGAAGILYRSNRDNHQCIALFEGAASLKPTGDVCHMTEDIPELLQVCDENDLVLRTSH